jgi:hypothetical protein
MAEVDARVTPILTNRFDSREHLVIHDWAASDCLTTVEWARQLLPLFPRSEILASDLLLHLVEVRVSAGERFFCEPGGALLQYVRRPFVIPMDPSWSRGDLFNRACQRCAQWRFHRILPANWASTMIPDPPDDNLPGVYRLGLAHPEAVRLRETDDRFRIQERSIFEPLPVPCNVIRTINILNRTYFDEPQLGLAIRNVWQSLAPGGIWIVGKTDENTGIQVTRATVYQRAGERWEELLSINGGTEIADIVQQLSFAAV